MAKAVLAFEQMENTVKEHTMGKWLRQAASRWTALALVVAFCGPLLGGCSLPQVSAEDRTFLEVSADLVGSYTLPKQTFDGEAVGGISAIAYDIPNDKLYGLSDNRDRPRFYTFTLSSQLNRRASNQPSNSQTPLALSIESVTYLKDANGAPYEPLMLDPEGMAITPAGTLLISTEGSPKRQIAPAIGEYDISTGQIIKTIPVPARYLPDMTAEPGESPQQPPQQTQGVQENLSFEALAVNMSSGTGGVYDPYRLFVATEGPLLQDLDFAPEIPYKNRLLHYTLDPYQTTLISEHLYEMELAPTGAILHGVSEIAVLDQSGHFLALERSYGFQGLAVKLYQLASGGATDISSIDSLQGDTSGISPSAKELVLDFASLGMPIQNYEAMTFGPSLGNQRRSLLIMSDDNFLDEQETQLLIFQISAS